MSGRESSIDKLSARLILPTSWRIVGESCERTQDSWHIWNAYLKMHTRFMAYRETRHLNRKSWYLNRRRWGLNWILLQDYCGQDYCGETTSLGKKRSEGATYTKWEEGWAEIERANFAQLWKRHKTAAFFSENENYIKELMVVDCLFHDWRLLKCYYWWLLKRWYWCVLK